MNRVFIAFGSNIGDRYETIKRAFELIEENEMKIIKKSSIYETEPYGYKQQPPFINGVILVETELSCRDVLQRLLKIEKQLGRERIIRWGPRTIDLDIIFYNNEVYNEEDLKVPHPDMHNREFVLKPLCDIEPDFVHPLLNKSVKEMYMMLKNRNE
ncbi:2-amino-4-hydroxy-6-hydroxymethyldihydropteridine diphosphokinase [Caloramator proteoclasticus]|uniref:2-amino-4-hydroxy-6-hydroxymethyldihydropteridine diphosphokinase n=1 Tax=Caloramator proteoclasticus DSM 10124 TaxID=1121262 RepID=A0A1M5AFW6_9CLOT|nr:2-amino-4-hydroxy-6-hydroxymethyldihydropteridine diphosphokinase [Caloramator proteoclasticus]SHF29047.1 2-amino-4-hydroxy-6-hydroxymethyldihydropteridinediphosphokinase [Caloramator proteoclasticus DSM 10124]